MGKTIPVYFSDNEMDLYEYVVSNSKHISKSGFIKTVLSEKAKNEEVPKENMMPRQKSQIPDLLDTF